jgi:hypothetical protein
MAKSFLIGVAIWFAINILVVAWRLWVTRSNRGRIDAGPRQFSPVGVQSRLRHHF